jgi:hypothetical protein
MNTVTPGHHRDTTNRVRLRPASAAATGLTGGDLPARHRFTSVAARRPLGGPAAESLTSVDGFPETAGS